MICEFPLAFVRAVHLVGSITRTFIVMCTFFSEFSNLILPAHEAGLSSSFRWGGGVDGVLDLLSNVLVLVSCAEFLVEKGMEFGMEVIVVEEEFSVTEGNVLIKMVVEPSPEIVRRF